MDNKIEGPHFEKTYWRETIGRVFVHPCAVCGVDNAAYGYDVKLRYAIKHRDSKYAGTWFCKEIKAKITMTIGGNAHVIVDNWRLSFKANKNGVRSFRLSKAKEAITDE